MWMQIAKVKEESGEWRRESIEPAKICAVGELEVDGMDGVR
jgi:hypothetical protein